MTNTLTTAQEAIIAIVKQYCPDTKVTETDYGVVWVNWTDNCSEKHWITEHSYMAKIGPRGGFKIVSAHCALDFDGDKKLQRTMAYNCLSAMRRESDRWNLGRLRGTVAIR